MTDTKLDLADYVGKGYGFLAFHGDPLQVVYQATTSLDDRPFLCVYHRRLEPECSGWFPRDGRNQVTRIPQKVRLERWAVVWPVHDCWYVGETFSDHHHAKECSDKYPGSRIVPFTIEFKE